MLRTVAPSTNATKSSCQASKHHQIDAFLKYLQEKYNIFFLQHDRNFHEGKCDWLPPANSQCSLWLLLINISRNFCQSSSHLLTALISLTWTKQVSLEHSSSFALDADLPGHSTFPSFCLITNRFLFLFFSKTAYRLCIWPGWTVVFWERKSISKISALASLLCQKLLLFQRMRPHFSTH